MASPLDQPDLCVRQRRKRTFPNDNIKYCKLQKLESSCSSSSSKSIDEDIQDGANVSYIGNQTCNKSGETTIDILPTTVIVKILKFLSLHDLLLSACLVCKHWCNLTRDPDLWREIDLKWQSKVTDEVLKRLCSYSSNVTSLCAPNLRTMVTGQGIQSILQQCSSLKRLILAGSMDLESSAFNAIGEYCHKLVYIDLSCCYNMNDEALTKMAKKCKLLEHVCLSQCQFITDDGVTQLAQGCPQLKALELKHNTKVTDTAIEALCKSCPQIEELFLTRCDVTSACLTHVAKLSQLRVLELASLGPVKPSEIYEVVKNCPNLSRLNLSLCQSVDDNCVDVIVKHAKHLSSLYLVSCSITDKSLLNLAKLNKTLERLDIGWCQSVTDSGVYALCHSCPHLKYLGLMRCDAVTNEAALTLSNKFPLCTISTVWLDCYRLLQKASKDGHDIPGL